MVDSLVSPILQVSKLNLDMTCFKCGYSEGLQQIVDSSDRPLAFVLGTRSGDPNSKGQGAYAPSSSYMPRFMRVRRLHSQKDSSKNQHPRMESVICKHALVQERATVVACP